MLSARETAEGRPASRGGGRGRWLGLAALWGLLVCYPNPLVLARNVARYLRLPIDPAMATTLPLPSTRDPAALEPAV